MSEEITQKKLATIAYDFSKAAMNRQDNVSFEDRMMDASSQDEAFELLGLGMVMADLRMKLGPESDNDPRYTQTTIAVAEKLADICSRFCSAAELKEFMPPAALEDGVAEAFASRDAKALAKILKP